jgi:hypothetical protein
VRGGFNIAATLNAFESSQRLEKRYQVEHLFLGQVKRLQRLVSVRILSAAAVIEFDYFF